MVSRKSEVLVHQEAERRCCCSRSAVANIRLLCLFLATNMITALIRLRGTDDVEDELKAMKVGT